MVAIMYKQGKVNYPKLAEIYSKKGRHAAIEYLKNSGIQAPNNAINRMKKRYMYDEELNKYIVPKEEINRISNAERNQQDSLYQNEDGFMSMEELCNNKTSPVEMEEEYIMPFPIKSRDAYEAEMFLDKLTEISYYFKLENNRKICHINKTELLKHGFNVIMY